MNIPIMIRQSKIYRCVRVVLFMASISIIYLSFSMPAHHLMLLALIVIAIALFISALLVGNLAKTETEEAEELLSSMTTEDAIREADGMSGVKIPEGPRRTFKLHLTLKCIETRVFFFKKGELVSADFVDPHMFPNTIHIVEWNEWFPPQCFHIWE